MTNEHGLKSRLIFEQSSWQLAFFGNQPGFEIGVVGSRNIDSAYNEAMRVFGQDKPLLILDSRHQDDNLVQLEYNPAESELYQCDAIIVPKQRLRLGAIYGDCGALVLESDHFISLAHAGRHELTATPPLVHEIISNWPERDTIRAFIGPIISGRYYQYPKPTPEQEKYGVDTIWPGIRGLEIKQMLIDQLIENGILPDNIIDCEIDPFAMRLLGDHDWASDQYCRRYLNPPQQTHRDLGLLQVL